MSRSIYKSLDQSTDPFDVKTSRTAREKFTELLRTKLADHTKNVIRPHCCFRLGDAYCVQVRPRPRCLLGAGDGIVSAMAIVNDASVRLSVSGRHIRA
jgi:hypothetical protein